MLGLGENVCQRQRVNSEKKSFITLRLGSNQKFFGIFGGIFKLTLA